MSTIGTYSFLPWLRQGIAGRIGAGPVPAGSVRASVRVQLELAGDNLAGGAQLTEPIVRDVELYGPGDIVGIETRAIVRTEPRDWITNFEPNMLAQIEFYDEDFPWRYTPAGPGGAGQLQLSPWIMLVVLESGEFENGQNIAERPLPYIVVPDASLLPPAADLWAWAHVHVNRTLAANDGEFVSSDMNAVLPRLQAVLDENADLAYSRIVCPRRLDENKAYETFLVPVFETGRLAGLGLDSQGAPGPTASAWASYGGREEPTNYPVYHRWYFRTGSKGDFEYLVRLLVPRPVDERVGVRDMDVQKPGANLPGITDAELGGILKLGGALRVPRASLDADELAEVEKYERWAQPYPHPFQEALASFVNLPDDYAATDAAAANTASSLGEEVEDDPDPLVTSPLYARWHALTRRLLRDRAGNPVSPPDNWVHELNLDPRHRVAAGFGTHVIQTNQESYMDAAWQQIGDVLEANRRIRAAQLAKETSWNWYTRHLLPLAAAQPERALIITAPTQHHVVAERLTVHRLRTLSRVPPTVTSAPMRRAIRPGARLARGVASSGVVPARGLLDRINRGEVSAAPPKVTPPGVVTVDEVASELLPSGVPRWLLDLLRQRPLLVYLPFLLLLVAALLLLLVLPLGAWLAAVVALGVAAFAAYRLLVRWRTAAVRASTIGEAGLTPEAVDALPTSPDFVVSEPRPGPDPTQGTTDSPDAIRFKKAAKDWHRLRRASREAAAQPPPTTLDLAGLTDRVVAAIDPEVTVPRRTRGTVVVPPRLQNALDEAFEEVMAYPEIDVPMYEPLAAISSELFLPNLNLVEPNSITLLETNQAFIEAYMVGLNHEFARELLWREYPTDQRGSYLRQFWDVRGYFEPGLSEEQRREKLRDVPPLHRWPRASKLSQHDHREVPGETEEEVVLVVRGELLKRYPTAVVYAHRAAWHTADGEIDPSRERFLATLSPEEEADPPRDKVKTPLYEAKVQPDVYFFGFDLAVTEARGESGENPDDEPGWFFVIKERPGEPRFGFDVDPTAPIQTFNDLSWNEALPGGGPGDHISASALGAIVLTPPGPGEGEKQDQHDEDVKIATAPVSAARWAYLLYQAPVMVAVHAAEMLDEP